VYLRLLFYIPDFPPQLRCFADRVNHRLKQAYRPCTQRAHLTAVIALASFCIYYDVAFPLIGIHTLLAFIEFLMSSDLAVPTVKNYISSIKTYFKCNGVNIEVLNHIS
jgi:hypothetical protein